VVLYLTELSVQAIKADLFISPSSGHIISGQSSFFSSRRPPARTIDLGGNILSPGLIDVQINGAYGIDFSEIDLNDPEAERKYTEGLDEVARRLVEMGTTSFVPTVITQEERLYRRVYISLSARISADW
jgi:N-acetylglucosamine-6-phosphate deacetylase